MDTSTAQDGQPVLQHSAYRIPPTDKCRTISIGRAPAWLIVLLLILGSTFAAGTHVHSKVCEPPLCQILVLSSSPLDLPHQTAYHMSIAIGDAFATPAKTIFDTGATKNVMARSTLVRLGFEDLVEPRPFPSITNWGPVTKDVVLDVFLPGMEMPDGTRATCRTKTKFAIIETFTLNGTEGIILGHAFAYHQDIVIRYPSQDFVVGKCGGGRVPALPY